MFLIFFFVLRGAEEKSDDCAIHPFLWLQIYFGLTYLAPLTLIIGLLCCFCAHPLRAACCIMVTLLIVLLTIASWVIYGWVLWTSEEKEECEDMKDTRIASIFMLIFCIFGLCIVGLAVACIFIVPICYCNVIVPALENPKSAKNAANSLRINNMVSGEGV